MIIDDEAGIRETLAGIFEDEGYEPVSVGSGEEAITLARETAPDLAILDVWLPGMDGIETLTARRWWSPSRGDRGSPPTPC